MLEIIMSWFILPLIMLVAGMITKKFPPKTINNTYGYRTKRSKKNQATWDFANEYISQLMIKTGAAELIIVAGIAYFYWNNFYVMFAVMCIESLSLIANVIATEVALRKRFDKNGMKISLRK